MKSDNTPGVEVWIKVNACQKMVPIERVSRGFELSSSLNITLSRLHGLDKLEGDHNVRVKLRY